MDPDTGWETVGVRSRTNSDAERRPKVVDLASSPRYAASAAVENLGRTNTNTYANGAGSPSRGAAHYAGAVPVSARPPHGSGGSAPKKKRPKRKHGEHATGVVRRRADWDDHCLIEMADGFEDVFCHRHRCQGKALPEQGQIVHFKLHLSSKSLCWQSGFVTWDENERVLPAAAHPAARPDDRALGPANENRAPLPQNVSASPWSPSSA